MTKIKELINEMINKKVLSEMRQPLNESLTEDIHKNQNVMNESVTLNKGQRWATGMINANKGRVGMSAEDADGNEMEGLLCITRDGTWYYDQSNETLMKLLGIRQEEVIITLTPDLKKALKKFVV